MRPSSPAIAGQNSNKIASVAIAHARRTLQWQIGGNDRPAIDGSFEANRAIRQRSLHKIAGLFA